MKFFDQAMKMFSENWLNKESKEDFEVKTRKELVEGFDYLFCVADHVSQTMVDDGRLFRATARLYAAMHNALREQGFSPEQATQIVSQMNLAK